MIVDKIYSYLSSEKKELNEALLQEVAQISRNAFERQFMKENQLLEKNLRLSSSGKCARQLAYGVHGFELNGKEIDSRSKLVFFSGDFAEMAIMALAKLSGCQIMASGIDQIELTLQVKDASIKGHPDGILFDFGMYLVECKSMTSYGFDEFEKGNIDDSYLAQINMYLDRLGFQKCVLVAFNKESGMIGERIVERDPNIIADTYRNLEIVLESTKENLPERKYKADEKGFLPWQCRYCAYYGHCWPNVKKVVVGKSYKLKLPLEVPSDAARD